MMWVRLEDLTPRECRRLARCKDSNGTPGVANADLPGAS